MKIISKLSWNIERTDVIGFINHYNYKFTSSQWLEKIDNPEYFGISHDSLKQKVINQLVDEFRMSLNKIVYSKQP